MSDIILIDRVDVVKKFTEMINKANERKMLRVLGAEKMGKSRVIREFRRITSQNENMSYALVDLRSKYQNYCELMFQIVQQITEVEFRNFTEAQRQAILDSKPEIKGLNMLLSSASINLSNHQSDTREQYHRHRTTVAFCTDLKCANLDRPIVLMFDTFDSASTTIQDWINEQFIPALLKVSNVFVVIAGRVLPDVPSSLEDICESYMLESVSLNDHKLFCTQFGIDISDETLADFHEVFEGTPGLFAEYVTKLKRSS